MFFLRHLFSVSFFVIYSSMILSLSSNTFLLLVFCCISSVCFSDASALCTWSQVLGFTAVFFSVPSSGHCHLFQKYPMWLFPCAVPRQWGDPWLSLLLFFFFFEVIIDHTQSNIRRTRSLDKWGHEIYADSAVHAANSKARDGKWGRWIQVYTLQGKT